MPDDFTNLNDIVKQFLELDKIFEVDVLEFKMPKKGQFKRLVDGLLETSWVLQCLSSKIDRSKNQVMEMKHKLSAPIKEHRFPYLHTCEDIFSQCSEYEKSNPIR